MSSCQISVSGLISIKKKRARMFRGREQVGRTTPAFGASVTMGLGGVKNPIYPRELQRVENEVVCASHQRVLRVYRKLMRREGVGTS